MHNTTSARFLQFVIVLFLIATLLSPAGCGDSVHGDAYQGIKRPESGEQETPGPEAAEVTSVGGWATLGSSPVTSALLDIQTLDGEWLLPVDESETSEFGSFRIGVENLPADFRVYVMDGSYHESPLEAELCADIRDFDPETGIVNINAVTTMVSAYLDAHSGTTLAEATAAVKRYLEVPDGVDIGSGLSFSGEFFNHAGFIEEALGNGGINAYIDQLVAEMDGTVTRSFPAESGFLDDGESSSVGAVIAGSLARGAVGYVGGEVMGYGLAKMGLGFPDATEEAIKEMQKQLAEIKNQIEQLDSKMSHYYQMLSSQITQSEYDTRLSGSVGDLISSINTIKGKLTLFITSPPADATMLEQKRSEIIDLIEEKIVGNEDIIHQQLVGFAGTTPLLKIWSQIVKNNKPFMNTGDFPGIRDQFNYFDMVQVWQMELLVEYYRAVSDDPESDYTQAEVQTVIDSYTDHADAQRELLLSPLPEGVYLYHNTDFNLLIYLPDDYGDTMSPNVTGKNESFWTFDSATVYTGGMSGYINEGIRRIMKMNNDGEVLGFNDWRMPKQTELTAMFKNWEGASSPGEYAASQGLTPMAGERLIPAWEESGTCGTIDCEYDWARDRVYRLLIHMPRWESPVDGFYYYRTTGGDFTAISWSDAWDDKHIFHHMPVRTLSTEELNRYFW